ncbi:heavy-metal-associated domain-containing protein [Glycomyces paridis]|uniref:Heavy-metal-associated domain-containing protein n=1 Tax=Glycomyces paridis TaxID=2126555 RepID=A0A4S8PI29_9ACTN|nr:heavy-metal-associated domain-containing protein [Glycomyces paridis]THV29072.1 heavy-metal-associated domain-containing protein [Glycomyces paridis]
MGAPQRIGLYAAGLAAVFAAAFAVAGVAVPESTVENWTATEGEHDMEGDEDMATDEHGGHDAPAAQAPRGLGIEQDGYVLGEVAAPTVPGAPGTLAFTITGPDGATLTEYTESHEKDLHLIVVRADGTGFRHVHPELGADGTWTIPWEWDAAGTYRVFADFVPPTGEDVTLSRTVAVDGDLTVPAPLQVSATAETDGFTVALAGDLVAGEASELTLTVTRDGEPVTALEPYLGAYGHLVALRDGDLAYLHVHPEGAEAEPGTVSGPDIVFAASAPTPGRYLLYLDFQVDGQVHTAQFAAEAR